MSSDKNSWETKETESIEHLNIDLFGNKSTEKSSSLSDSKIPQDFSDCNKIWELFSKCMSTTYQINHIHRYGKNKSCSNRFSDFRKCMHVKFLKDPVEIMVSNDCQLNDRDLLAF